MSRTKSQTQISAFPINTLVRITATGGQAGDWWERVALTGTAHNQGGYHITNIQVIHPETGELVQRHWRTEWLEVLPQGEQPEEVEALTEALALCSNSSTKAMETFAPKKRAGEPSSYTQQASNDNITEVSELAAFGDETRVAPIEILEELTQQEEKDRHRLERKVERAFYEAALALREIHQRKLYRSTHSRFAHYCRDRFGFSQQNADLLIRAAQVILNLKVTTIGCNFLPTSERQVRPLTKLQPDEQREVWQQAVKIAGGKVPSGSIVKGVVQRLKERDNAPPPIPYSEGDVVMIRGLGNPDLRKFDGRWAVALRINEYTVTVALDAKDVPVNPQFLEPVDPQYWAEIKAVNERITRLQLERNLDPADDAVLEVLRRRSCFTSRQILLLERMEQDYALT